jgi:hypothetical protein
MGRERERGRQGRVTVSSLGGKSNEHCAIPCVASLFLGNCMLFLLHIYAYLCAYHCTLLLSLYGCGRLCRFGGYGRLGHNGATDELMPREISSLFSDPPNPQRQVS